MKQTTSVRCPRRQQHRVRLSTGLLALGLATVARAQGAPPLMPPVPQSGTDVVYPAGAAGDAVITLELVIEADGRVASAVVLDGAEPFAEQARRAAVGWTF